MSVRRRCKEDDMEDTSADLSACINVTAEIPNPILSVEQVEDAQEERWSKSYRDKFSKLFNELTNELDIMSRHEAKVQKIRFELMQLLEKGDKKSKKGKK